MKKLGLLFLTLAFAVLAAGCATKEEQGTVFGASTGALLGGAMSRGNPAAVVGGALVGGFIGNRIGKSMDDEDRRRAYDAQMAAFERGDRADWRSPNGHYGYIEPRPVYYYREMRCREFSQTVFINGRPETMVGRACRYPDGTWREV
ncbi:MAG: glycine zipper domain-containing protein [Rhodomicrobium sp.]